MPKFIDHLQASPMSSRLDREKLMMLNTDTAAKSAFLVLDHLHDMKPEEACVAISVAFAAFAQRVSMAPDELHAVGLKVLREGERPFHKNTNALLASLTDFAKFKVRTNPMI